MCQGYKDPGSFEVGGPQNTGRLGDWKMEGSYRQFWSSGQWCHQVSVSQLLEQ